MYVWQINWLIDCLIDLIWFDKIDGVKSDCDAMVLTLHDAIHRSRDRDAWKRSIAELPLRVPRPPLSQVDKPILANCPANTNLSPKVIIQPARWRLQWQAKILLNILVTIVIHTYLLKQILDCVSDALRIVRHTLHKSTNPTNSTVQSHSMTLTSCIKYQL